MIDGMEVRMRIIARLACASLVLDSLISLIGSATAAGQDFWRKRSYSLV